MPRRNHREPHQPLDLTPKTFPEPQPLGYHLPPAVASHRAEMRKLEQSAERVERQAKARAQGGIDWSICLIPGCGKDLRVFGARTPHAAPDRDASRHLPLCYEHGLIAWRQVQKVSDLPVIIETAAAIEKREQERALAEVRRRVAARGGKGDHEGLMYFVRINNLVKVGWTQNLPRRLKEYGAGAVLLVHYPATSEEETELHRSLRPALAKGREWYHDGDVIQLFVKNALQRHGPPTVKAFWTKPRPEAIKLRRR